MLIFHKNLSGMVTYGHNFSRRNGIANGLGGSYRLVKNVCSSTVQHFDILNALKKIFINYFLSHLLEKKKSLSHAFWLSLYMSQKKYFPLLLILGDRHRVRQSCLEQHLMPECVQLNSGLFLIPPYEWGILTWIHGNNNKTPYSEST